MRYSRGIIFFSPCWFSTLLNCHDAYFYTIAIIEARGLVSSREWPVHRHITSDHEPLFRVFVLKFEPSLPSLGIQEFSPFFLLVQSTYTLYTSYIKTAYLHAVRRYMLLEFLKSPREYPLEEVSGEWLVAARRRIRVKSRQFFTAVSARQMWVRYIHTWCPTVWWPG